MLPVYLTHVSHEEGILLPGLANVGIDDFGTLLQSTLYHFFTDLTAMMVVANNLQRFSIEKT